MQKKYKRVAVKIGSNVLTNREGALDLPHIGHLVDQVVALHRAGIEVVLVSSGAVAAGRSSIKPDRKLDAVSSRQLFSAVGQAKLMNCYHDLFGRHDVACGQILTMKESFGTRRHYLNQKHCIEVMLEHSVVPIVNENDTISVTELMFTDNDELSGLMATMINADALVILSNIDGIYNGSPADPESQVIRLIGAGKRDLSQYIQTQKSQFGRGGMLTKCNIARKVAEEGIEVIIANGKKENVLIELLKEERDIVCTRFEPSVKSVSGVKKWIAHSDGFAKGELHINEGAYSALMSNKATSLLPIGVVRIEGEFEKDDIVKIVSPSGVQIGVGRVSMDSGKARGVIVQSGGRPLVHYDYLYLEG